MVNRLDPINMVDFSGGLNLRANTFQLAPNESPEMENISVDPLGGIYTRLGWDRWSGPDIVDPAAVTWDPRRAYLVQLSDGTDVIYIASDHKLYSGLATSGAAIANMSVSVDANPHMADFASFGDDVYIARGASNQIAKRHAVAASVTLLVGAGSGNWNNDYSNPVRGVAPRSELIEAHSGYLFTANITQDGVAFPNRIRWSHPTSPEDWAEADYIDINAGGSEITALLSFEDHLLIFKADSIWALYGYDQDSWQVVQKSSTIGAMSPQSVTRSETAAFFYSASDRGGIYAYGGERAVEISAQLRRAMELLISPELVWVGWIARKLWVTLPWTYDTGPTDDVGAVFVFDPSVGDGAWTYYSCMSGGLGPIVAGSNVDSQLRPLGVVRATETPCVVRLEAISAAADRIWNFATLVADNPLNSDPEGRQEYLVTDTGAQIEVGGAPGYEPFRTSYRTPWISAQWPTRKKSFRRPDFICRITGLSHNLSVASYRDYDERNPKRRHTVVVPGGIGTGGDATAAAIWGHFAWGDGTEWGQQGSTENLPQEKVGASIRRGSSFGLCRSLQLRIAGMTPSANWGIDAIILKIVMRRFR